MQDINKLKATGICTILSVSQTTRRNLLKIKGLSEAKVEKLKEAAAKMLPPTFATAAEIGLRRECCVMIATGSKTVDAMLGGQYCSAGSDRFELDQLADILPRLRYLSRRDTDGQLD